MTMEYILVTLFIGAFALGMYLSWRRYKPKVEWGIDVIV